MTKLTLLCLPYSGASAMVYSRWRRQLPPWLHLQPVELPGRGARYDEPLQTDMRALALQLAREHKPSLHGPYALFGHSLGGVAGLRNGPRLSCPRCCRAGGVVCFRHGRPDHAQRL